MQQKLLTYLLLLFLSSANNIQATTISDSLQNTLEISHDTLKAKIYISYVSENLRQQPELCLQYLERAIEISEQMNQPANLARAYSLSGVIYKNRAEYSTALSFHHQSLKINEQLNLRTALASNYNDIGIIYKTIGEFDKALESYTLANAIAVELDLKKGVVMTLNNIGTIYEAKNQQEDAITYYNRAYSKALEYDIIDAQAIVLNNLGDIYATKGDGKKAREYFKETLAIDKKTNDNIGSILSILNIAATMVGTKEFDSAFIYYSLAEKMAIDISANHLIYSVYLGLTSLYQEKKDYKNAFLSLQQAQIFQDSIYNENSSRQIAEVEAKFESERKDNEIAMLQQEKLIRDYEIKQSRSDIFALIILIILGGIISFILYKRFQMRQLQLFNKKMLKQKEDHLVALVENQEIERKRIAKDLHDGVGQTLSGIKLALMSLENSSTPEPIKLKFNDLTKVIDQACSDVRTISHQMMPRILQEEGLIPAITDMLDKSFKHSTIQYEFEHFGLQDRFKENVEVGLYRISQELINNIIKHSGADRVSVQLFVNKKVLVLLVEDNGKGFQFNKLKNEGIGLMNISSRVETIHGEFNLEPSPESGTLATIRIPI